MTSPKVSFLLEDYPRTLFPLETNKIVIEHSTSAVSKYIYQDITAAKTGQLKFLPQTRAWATKAGMHLRRTTKLDPVAEFFLYDLVYRNRRAFRPSSDKTRINYGYRFVKGRPMTAAAGYKAFRIAVAKALKDYKYCAKFDVSSYFNSIYHHDLVSWFREIADNDSDVDFLDKFLKQTNAGRSVDCLPQGLYPAKIIGSHFLDYIDASSRLTSPLLLRFMDDFYVFSDTDNDVVADFLRIQEELGRRGLSVNPSKTKLSSVSDEDIGRPVDTIKLELLQRRGRVLTASSADPNEDEDLDDEELSDEELQYLQDLMKTEDIEEEDAELVLAMMRDHSEVVLEHLPAFLAKFPNLSKNVYHFAQFSEDPQGVAEIVRAHAENHGVLPEFQLFWLGKILQDQLLETSHAGDLVALLIEHPNATLLTRAKILEIPDGRFGLPELREEQLRGGASIWPAWAAAVGTRHLKRASRNHLLDYFGNGSELNALIAGCVRSLR
jgi:hypothetical protein